MAAFLFEDDIYIEKHRRIMEYIKLFNTTSEYNTYTSGDYAKPNVSYCVDENKVHYNPIDPYNGHAYVEIGGLKWATMNIGATAVTDTGLYFQWGDTSGYTAAQVGTGSGQKAFKWADYKYGNGTSSPSTTGMTKYNEGDSKITLESTDDAVKAAWGGSWRIPTTAEFQALGAAVNTAWTSSYEGSGVKGLVLTSKADSSKKLFFPAAGFCSYGRVSDVGSYGHYWSSSLYSGGVYYAYNLYFGSGSASWVNYLDRCRGCQVRGVVG